jgi:hypothetical protein
MGGESLNITMSTLIMKWFKKETRAERNEKNFKKWLNSYIPKATNQRIELVRIFTDRNDNNWYILKNAGQLTKERSQRIEESMLAIEYGVSKQEIMDKMNDVLTNVKDLPWMNATKDKLRQFVESAQNVINDLLFRMKNITLDDMLIQAGLYFFYIDGENPYIINEETQQRKLDAIRQDDELRSFFLTSMEQILRGLSDTKK